MVRIGFGPRLVASIIDMILSFIVGSIFAFTKVFSFFDLSNSAYFNSQEFNDIETSLEMFGSDINLSDVQIWILGYFIGVVLYTLIEGVTGASPGKRAQKIIIANEDGSEGDVTLFMSRWAIKNISNLMSLLIILTGAISIQWVGSLLGWVVFLGCFLVLASHRQALHDKIVKTAVFNS